MTSLIVSSILLFGVLGAILYFSYRSRNDGRLEIENKQNKKLLVSIEKDGRAIGQWINDAEKLAVKGEGLKRETKDIFARGPDVSSLVSVLDRARGESSKASKASKAKPST